MKKDIYSFTPNKLFGVSFIYLNTYQFGCVNIYTFRGLFKDPTIRIVVLRIKVDLAVEIDDKVKTNVGITIKNRHPIYDKWMSISASNRKLVTQN